MVDWKITAKTIYCEKADDEVTILVRNDWSVSCTGHSKYGANGASAKNGKGCEEYKNQLIREEG